MALFQSTLATGKQPSPNTYRAGEVTAVSHTHTLTADLDVTDILEIACLPAGCIPVSLRLMVDSDSSSGITAKVGLLSNSFGDPTKPDGTARTLGSEFGATASIISKALVEPALDVLRAIAPVSDRHRGIGMQPSIKITKGTKKVHVIFEYVAAG